MNECKVNSSEIAAHDDEHLDQTPVHTTTVRAPSATALFTVWGTLFFFTFAHFEALEMCGGGLWGVAPGQVTGHSELLLCTAAALAEAGGGPATKLPMEDRVDGADRVDG